jgi:8-oxo-dGTP diphosphatase
VRAFLYKIGFPIVKIYWFIFRPKTSGAGCVIECNGNILLIKNTYGSGNWTFPGGGSKKNENIEETCRREVEEEVGIKLFTINSLGSFLYTKAYKKDTIHVFSSVVESPEIKIDKNEIKEAHWFPIDEIRNSILSNVGVLMFKMFTENKRS